MEEGKEKEINGEIKFVELLTEIWIWPSAVIKKAYAINDMRNCGN